MEKVLILKDTATVGSTIKTQVARVCESLAEARMLLAAKLISQQTAAGKAGNYRFLAVKSPDEFSILTPIGIETYRIKIAAHEIPREVLSLVSF